MLKVLGAMVPATPANDSSCRPAAPARFEEKTGPPEFAWSYMRWQHRSSEACGHSSLQWVKWYNRRRRWTMWIMHPVSSPSDPGVTKIWPPADQVIPMKSTLRRPGGLWLD